MHAELTYLFRHALLRDAAYQLQMPGDRARLHLLALDIIEQLVSFGGSPLNLFAAELANHARAAAVLGGDAALSREAKYLLAAAEYMQNGFELVGAMEYWNRLSTHPMADKSTRAKALYRVGGLAHKVGELGAAEAALNRAAQSYQELQDAHGEAMAQEALADVMRETGRAQAALQIYRGLSKVWPLRTHNAASVLAKIAIICEDEKSLSQAAEAYEAAIGANSSDMQLLARLQMSLSALLRRLGRREEALALARSARANLGHVQNAALADALLLTCGAAHDASGLHEEAELIYDEALERGLRAGARGNVALALLNKAIAQRNRGRLDLAERDLRRSIAQLLELGDLGQLATAQRQLGLLLIEQERWAPARAELDCALQVAQRAGAARVAAMTRCHLGRVAEAVDGYEASLATFREALARAEACGEIAAAAQARCGEAIALAALGRLDESRVIWDQALPLVRKREGAAFAERCEHRLAKACAAAAARHGFTQ
jgi:tetratricopeptide (TPR) repeat protein